MTMTNKKPSMRWREAAWAAVIDVQTATSVMTSPEPHIDRLAVLLLPSEPESASTAREFVREHVGHHVPDAGEAYVDNVLLITSELVTNSIRYGTKPDDSVRLVIDTDDRRTRIEVHDPIRRRPRPRPESDQHDRGRGLIILDALCPGQWGVFDTPPGKAVWAEVKAR
ncbi:ATP-binding protein [Streptomyces sp. NPDC059037]|uniref:ATP-binding protein n=1 Tax=Streptomyces sp. NPDC059037 TaxID=3346710 RepID=UPI00367D79B7